MKKAIVFVVLALSVLSLAAFQSPARAYECSGVSYEDAEDAVEETTFGDGADWEGFSDIADALPYTGGSVSTNKGGDQFIRQRPGCR